MSTPTLDDLCSVSDVARRMRSPVGRDSLTTALSSGWLLVPLGVPVGTRVKMCRAWRHWCVSRQSAFVYAVLCPRDSLVALEMIDPNQLSDAADPDMDIVMRGANSRTATWSRLGGRVICTPEDAPLVAACLK